MSKLLIREMSRADLAQVSSVHSAAFPGFFLTSLGGTFLRSFYSACCSFDRGICLVADLGGTVAGFAVGVPDHHAFHSYLRRRWLPTFALKALPAVLRRPWILSRFAAAALSRGSQMPRGEGALLMSIAVDPRVANRGVGRKLLLEFGAGIRAAGLREYRLTTDGGNNERVNGFYVASALELECSYTTPRGRLMNQYVCRCGAVPPSGQSPIGPKQHAAAEEAVSGA